MLLGKPSDFLSRRIFITGLLIATLAGCGAPPKQVRIERPVEQVPETKEPVALSPDDFLTKARESYQTTGDIRLRNQWVLKAADAYASEQDCTSALKIVHLVRPELLDNVSRTHANVLSAECALQQGFWDVDEISGLLMKSATHVGFDKRIAALYVELYQSQSRWLDVARSVLETDWEDVEKNQVIWQVLQQLNESELESARLRETKLQPWLQLALIVHRYGLSPSELRTAYQDWQNRFANTLVATSPPLQITQALALTPTAAEQVAVVLPLSGRLSAQGEAIKDGILAAYFETPSTNEDDIANGKPVITFYDSMRLDEQAISAIAESDALIGPLLKDNIVELGDKLPDTLPSLALNRVSRASEPDAPKYYFGLLPEDEAVQLADYVRGKGIRYPVVIAHDSPTPTRMAQAFLTTWRQSAGVNDPEPGYTRFTDNKSMRTSVTGMLDVAQSKSRIKTVEALLDEELHSVPRNRRDIDAIILFSNAEQTELLNPIIESSLSPFNNRIVPVYASSRSYTLQRSNNSLRDLQNLTFTDMPWMLPGHKWQPLSEQTKQLWPEKNDTLRRLFALGYDSFRLLPNLPQLRLLPQLSVEGLSGELSVTPDGYVMRKLPMGKVDEDRVTLVALD